MKRNEMQLSEIKNDLAKIVYKPLEVNLLLADFLLIEDENQSLISQIISIESEDDSEYSNSALVKFVLSIDKNLCLSTYNGYTPSKDSKILYIEPSEIVQLLKTDEKTMLWGEMASHPDCKVELSLNLLDNKPYIQCERLENLKTISESIMKGLEQNEEKFVLIDFDKTFEDFKGKKIVVGKDFKLPLNYEILDFIYQNDLKDCPVDERGYVQDILIDIQNYVRSMADGFIPFDVFKKVVDEQYAANPSSVGLILLRNKLIKYADDGILAQSKSDFSRINNIIKESGNVVIDAFSINENWQKILVEFLSTEIKEECYFMLNFTESNSTKKIISNMYSNEAIKPVSFSSYSFKHSTTLKAMARNLVLALPLKQTDDFAGYNSFLHKLNQEEYVIWGQNTLYIPLILRPVLPKVTEISKAVDFEIKRDVDEIFTAQPKKNEETAPGEVIETPIFLEEEPVSEPVQEDDAEEENVSVDELEDIFEDADETEVEADEESVGEEPEAAPEAQEEQIVNILEDDEESFEEIFEAAEEETVEEYETEPEEEEPFAIPEEQAPQAQNAPGLNIAQPTLPNAEPQKQFTPIPIYQAQTGAGETAVSHKFKEGNLVNHPKYGKGIVEKNITYGTKSLCSIQFENIGRRLLDPDLAELTPFN